MLFFFSSRRRHTRYIGDWSSDVCSSDLSSSGVRIARVRSSVRGRRGLARPCVASVVRQWRESTYRAATPALVSTRSEERRVGKECRSERWGGSGIEKQKHMYVHDTDGYG